MELPSVIRCSRCFGIVLLLTWYPSYVWAAGSDHHQTENKSGIKWYLSILKFNFNKTIYVHCKHFFQTWQWKVSPPSHLHHHHPVSRFFSPEVTTPIISCISFHQYLHTYTQLHICISPLTLEVNILYTSLCILLFSLTDSGSVSLGVMNHSLTNPLLVDT